ncbi:hypothetical protein [Mesorhizobium sp. M0674]|uniref:hypothetical protein n=1 Tax=unclassified Mesorhizobium TaxID=325217 RepID=UPI0033362F8D
MKGVARVFAIAGVVLVGGYPCNAAPLDTMAEVGDAIQACWGRRRVLEMPASP